MANDIAREVAMPGTHSDPPCATLQVLAEKVQNMESWQKRQNGHLANIDEKLAEVRELLAQHRADREKQVNDVERALVGQMNRQYSGLLKWAISMLLPILASLAFLILQYLMKP